MTDAVDSDAVDSDAVDSDAVDSDAVIGTLRLRGDHAARLARVAATALPAALGASLADVADCSIDTLRIRLDVDPGADDETIAAVWADAIRAELVRAVGIRQPAAVGASRGAGRYDAPPTMPDAMAAASAWLEYGPPRPALSHAVLRALADAAAAREGTAAASDELARLAGRVAFALRPTGQSRATSHHDQTPPSAAPPREPHPASGEPGEVRERSVGRADGQRVRDAAAAPLAGEDVPATAQPPQREAVAAELSALADLLEPGEALDPLALTGTAGLALLYPWLADLCRAAMDLHPGLDGAAVRAHALAALVDPADPSLRDDPFVALLAGLSGPLGEQTPLPRAAEVEDLAQLALASFASLIPGFAESTPAFVRREWVRRRGILDASADPARLTAVTHPLDVVLTRLPYPLGLFRLPWGPPVAVRFRP